MVKQVASRWNVTAPQLNLQAINPTEGSNCKLQIKPRPVPPIFPAFEVSQPREFSPIPIVMRRGDSDASENVADGARRANRSKIPASSKV